MKKPKSYDVVYANTKEKVLLGGHKMVIKQVTEMQSKTGKEMICVAFDFDSSDRQKSLFMNMFKADERINKKYPFQGLQYIITTDEEGNASKRFKSFITALQNSNPGWQVKWDIPDWHAQFVGKKIGGVFGDQREVYMDKVYKRQLLRYFCDYEKAEVAEIPKVSDSYSYKNYIENQNNGSTQNDDTTSGFVNIPDTVEVDELPFD